MKRGAWILAFPLTVVAFVGPTVEYVNLIFTLQTRWLCAGFLTILLLLTGRTFQVLLYDVGLALAVNVGWAIFTYSWSEAPDLTLMKSFALALVSLSLLGGGQFWVSRLGWRRTLDYILPIVGIAVFASVLGQGAVVKVGSDFTLYQGLTDNPNMLGSLMNMAIPCVLWHTYRLRGSKKWLAFWLCMLALIAGVLLLSVSRASILATAITCVAFLAMSDIRRNAALVALAGIAAASAVMAIPDVFEGLQQRYVRKVDMDSEAEVLSSRLGVWEESYDQAVKGGLVGGGYGVTIGETEFTGGFTAYGYGREKGNSQLAIVEETGIIGLGFYLVFLFVLLKRATLPILRGRDRDMKVMGALVLGALIGQIAQSIFEAWWVAPGSPEAAYFWAMAGVALGLSVESRKWLSTKQPAPTPAASWALPERIGAFLHRRN